MSSQGLRRWHHAERKQRSVKKRNFASTRNGVTLCLTGIEGGESVKIRLEQKHLLKPDSGCELWKTSLKSEAFASLNSNQSIPVRETSLHNRTNSLGQTAVGDREKPKVLSESSSRLRSRASVAWSSRRDGMQMPHRVSSTVQTTSPD